MYKTPLENVYKLYIEYAKYIQSFTRSMWSIYLHILSVNIKKNKLEASGFNKLKHDCIVYFLYIHGIDHKKNP